MSRALTVTACLLAAALAAHGQPSAPPPPVAASNVVWDTPSGDSSGSMPMGNGDIGMNVWVEDNGDLLLLLSKTDAWDQNGLPVKVGRVRIALSPTPFAKGGTFRQELRLQDGRIDICGGRDTAAATLRVWVDANRPVICVEADSASESSMTVRVEPWRVQEHTLTETEFRACRDIETPESATVVPDVMVEDTPERVTWYHRNETSQWPVGMKLQGMESVMDRFADPLLHRTFGATVLGKGLVRKDLKTLASGKASTTHEVCIIAYTAQTATIDEWKKQLAGCVKQALSVDAGAARAENARWWREFWDRSWVRVGGDADAETVTQAYALQRWVSACAGRGAEAIKFNGSIFTVELREKGEVKSDPDYRAWGGAYWWQNTRLPYWPMLASGDYDLMRPMFKMYLDSLELARARNRIWFQCDGAVMAETMHFWGMYCNVDYGWKRDGLKTGEMINPYIRWIWSSGIELTMMMLDYYDHTGDADMLKDQLVPWADAMLRYFDARFKRDGSGKLLLDPDQSIETYQDGVTNDTPSVAGLHAVLPRLLALPEGSVDADMRTRWQKLSGELPDLPVGERKGKRVILPAKTFKNRGNCENPELYALFPFRLYGVGRPDLQLAQDTYDTRVERAFHGWQQNAIDAACLGRADDARRMLVSNAKRKNEGSRFPAFWGPNYDWIPDQCHGGNLLNTVQTMLLQTDGDKVMLFPAWPKDWDVSFKLHAPGNTTIEGTLRGGKVRELTVTPPERGRDVTVRGGMEGP